MKKMILLFALFLLCGMSLGCDSSSDDEDLLRVRNPKDFFDHTGGPPPTCRSIG